jgi:flagellin
MSVINTNITSLISQQNLNKSQSALTTAMQRLSSGSRINSAKDDAAGQAIANRMTSQITGLTQAQRNANDGISVAQTTEGALNQINDNLQRIRELTVQSQNGTNSPNDLTSIQNEITQRLDEINRISGETNFNGTKVLNADQKLNIQVGANDGETISLNLKQINAQTLGLDGFNVDGNGVTQNRTATVTDLLAAGATGTGPYTITTTHKAATFDQVLGQMQTGNKVTTSAAAGSVAYTYDASKGNFSYTATVDSTNAAARGTLATSLTPATGTKTGTYQKAGSGDIANFEVDAAGKITIDGQAAYISAAGELTTNSGTGGTAATMDNLLKAMGDTTQGGGKLTMDSVTYTGATSGNITYTATASKDEVKTAVAGDTGGSTATLGSGITAGTVAFGASSTSAASTYVDSTGELTTVASFNTSYAVDANTGKVTVSGGTGTGKYAPDTGATVYVNSSGLLTTDTTSKGDKTENPLAALDAALKQVDTLRSDMGAIQNRFDSAITNLTTTTTNLSAARSRIQDADYSVEVANMTKAQILQQAGTSVLAQANKIPQGVLSLLQ